MIALTIEAKARAAQQAHRHRAWLAYHVGVMVRAKRPPSLRALIGGKVSGPRRQSTTRQRTEALRLSATGFGVFRPGPGKE